MAKIFPSIFPYNLDDPEMLKLGIQTEYEVYNKLKKFSDEFEIFCGPKFLKKNIHGDMRDGEYADFIIIHKNKGILFLECKGGNISYNPNEVRWYQNKKQLKKSPIKQANDGKLNLINFLKSPKYREEINIDAIPTIHGAIFPNTPKPDNLHLGADIKPEMIIWAQDYDEFEKSIINLLDINQSTKDITEDEKRLVQRILYGDRLDNPFKEILKHGEHMQEIEFDEDQRMLYNFMFSNKRLIIRGLAGTGKTILAAKKATEESNNEKKVLVLTKTVGVGRFLSLLTRSKQFKRNFLEISSIDGFVSNLARRLKMDISNPQKLEDDEKRKHFDEYLPNLCKKIFEENVDKKFDVLIVDEGQDFHKNWYEVLKQMVKDDGHMFLFYDPLQKQISNSMAETLNENKDNYPYFNLTANYRNSSSITNFLSKLINKFYSDVNASYSKFSKFDGKKPEFIVADTFDEIVDKSKNKVLRLISEEKFNGSDIAILSDLSMKPANYNSKNSLRANLEENDLEVISAREYAMPYIREGYENKITFDSIKRFKGLEKPIIILVNLDNNLDNEDKMRDIYSGLSRARGHLIIVSNQQSISYLRDLYKN
ncbi:NERD domain-containing protein [Candidatus Pelagibacter sp. HIMB1495]|uniref:nuclease-related domain-containing DEAD/DEAH box helicase n=1 Tax=unclassified Candidatus Pelagibacter TaxID=2647897 RepID=UPI003F871008